MTILSVIMGLSTDAAYSKSIFSIPARKNTIPTISIINIPTDCLVTTQVKYGTPITNPFFTKAIQKAIDGKNLYKLYPENEVYYIMDKKGTKLKLHSAASLAGKTTWDATTDTIS